MTMLYRMIPLLFTTLMLAACASGPKYPTEGVETTLTPRQAVAESDSQTGKKVLWGGMIINSTNLENRTRLEVLGYPLDSKQQPEMDQEPLGRFLLFQEGYLETVDYAPGRQITVIGRFTQIQEGKVDETSYTYPVVESDQLYLWPRRQGRRESNIQFGFGLIFSN